MPDLYPEIEPYAQGMLEVTGGALCANVNKTVTPLEFNVEGEQGSESDERSGDDVESA